MIDFNNFSELEIIGRILSGEKPLYEIIVRRFNPVLYKIGRSYNLSHEDAQDVMQDTFIDAYKNLKLFDGRSQFKTWIIRIMLNNCYRKKRKFSHQFELTHSHNESHMHTDSHNDTQKQIQNRELGHIIEEAIGQIPETYRMVFSLREINGLSVAETAELLDISESNVKVRLNRAKAMLRTEIEKSYSGNEIFEFHARYCDAMTKRVMDQINAMD